MKMPDKESPTKETCYHEAGHAVVLYHFGIDLEEVSVLPDDGSAGRVAHSKPQDLDWFRPDDYTASVFDPLPDEIRDRIEQE